MANADVMQKLEELMAREAIKELRARYCWHVVRGESEHVAALYTPDGVFEVNIDGERWIWQGQKAILGTLKMTSAGSIVPLIHNHTVTISGDEAYGTCVLEAHAPGAPVPDYCGYYHDRLRRVGGRWLFVERRWFRYWPNFQRSGLDIDGTSAAR